jgi:hypothetical protein
MSVCHFQADIFFMAKNHRLILEYEYISQNIRNIACNIIYIQKTQLAVVQPAIWID